MTNKFEVQRAEFNLLPRNTKGFKEFLQEVPDTAAYRIETRADGVFFSTYWINVNETTTEDVVVTDAYTIHMPHICVYGKLAQEAILNTNACDGIPFILDATETIHLTKGFVDILVRHIKDYQAPYIVAKGWVKEHMEILDEISTKYRVVIRMFESDDLL